MQLKIRFCLTFVDLALYENLLFHSITPDRKVVSSTLTVVISKYYLFDAMIKKMI